MAPKKGSPKGQPLHTYRQCSYTGHKAEKDGNIPAGLTQEMPVLSLGEMPSYIYGQDTNKGMKNNPCVQAQILIYTSVQQSSDCPSLLFFIFFDELLSQTYSL